MSRYKVVLVSLIIIMIAFSLTIVSSFIYKGSEYQHITVNGRNRSYLLRLPVNYSDNYQWPLVLGLHGGGANAEAFETRTGFTEIANREGFIVCYPNGNGPLEYSMLTWNAGYCCGYALDEGIDDIAYIRTLIDYLTTHYSIDMNRIYVTGMSNGGILTHQVGATLSDILAAIAPIAATIGGYETRDSELYTPPIPEYNLPILMIHGTDDTHVAYYGGHAILAAGTRIDLSFNKTVTFWIESNEAALVSNETVGDLMIRKYAGENTRSDVFAYTIIGGLHVWPGENADPLKAIQASELVWSFFENHTRS